MPFTTISVWLGVSMVMPSGTREIDRVREPQGEGSTCALRLGAIADTLQLKLALKARGHTLDHVGQVGAGGTRLHAHGIVRAVLDVQHLLRLLDGPCCHFSSRLKEPLAPLDGDLLGRHRGRHALGQWRPALLQLCS